MCQALYRCWGYISEQYRQVPYFMELTVEGKQQLVWESLSETEEPYQSSAEGISLFTQEIEEGSSEEVTFIFDFSDNFNSLILSWVSWTKNNKKVGTA